MLRLPTSSHCKLLKKTTNPNPTGVAQRQRARLITARSFDQNGSPVFRKLLFHKYLVIFMKKDLKDIFSVYYILRNG